MGNEPFQRSSAYSRARRLISPKASIFFRNQEWGFAPFILMWMDKKKFKQM